MSSSPPTSPVQRAFSALSQPREVDKYRQTVYRDGAGCRIAESRRRPRTGQVARSVTSTYLDWVLYPTNDAPMSPKSHQANILRHDPTSGPCPKKSGLATHVTSAKRRSIHGKSKDVVIIEAQRPAVTSSKKMVSSVQMLEELTPPPTPRIERLSTPDLPDLDEQAFCDCGVDAHLIRLCTCCNKEAKLCMV